MHFLLAEKIAVFPASSRREASVPRTLAFYCSSPRENFYKAISAEILSSFPACLARQEGLEPPTYCLEG